MEAVREGLSSRTEGSAIHHEDFVIPTVEDHLTALKDAGIDDVQAAWRRFDIVLIMGRKR